MCLETSSFPPWVPFQKKSPEGLQKHNCAETIKRRAKSAGPWFKHIHNRRPRASHIRPSVIRGSGHMNPAVYFSFLHCGPSICRQQSLHSKANKTELPRHFCLSGFCFLLSAARSKKQHAFCLASSPLWSIRRGVAINKHE